MRRKPWITKNLAVYFEKVLSVQFEDIYYFKASILAKQRRQPGAPAKWCKVVRLHQLGLLYKTLPFN